MDMSALTGLGTQASSGGGQRNQTVMNMASRMMPGGGAAGSGVQTTVQPQLPANLQAYNQAQLGQMAPGGVNATPVGFESMFPNVQQPAPINPVPGLQAGQPGAPDMGSILQQLLGGMGNGLGASRAGVKPGQVKGNGGMQQLLALLVSQLQAHQALNSIGQGQQGTVTGWV